MNHTVNLLDT